MRSHSAQGGVSRCRMAPAYSLLEVVLASALCASALVPALAILRDGLSLGRNIDARHMLLVYGVGKMEEQAAIVAATWTEGTIVGDFAADGHAEVRYAVTRSDDSSDGGISGQLMNVTVITYRDDDGDDSLDIDEPQISFTTKIAKLGSYEDKAQTW